MWSKPVGETGEGDLGGSPDLPNTGITATSATTFDRTPNRRLLRQRRLLISAKYGLDTERWQTKWLRTESNAEVRKALIQGIGYERIYRELKSFRLDVWREYTLLRIDGSYQDLEPIVLLKMTCPSTKSIHLVRVPPNIRSAREAISWANWDIDPEKFVVET